MLRRKLARTLFVIAPRISRRCDDQVDAGEIGAGDQVTALYDLANAAARFDAASADLRFAFATAAFADVLRGSEDAKHWSLAESRAIAAGGTSTAMATP